MKCYFLNIWEVIITIAKSMAVTITHFSPARKSITVQYPDKTDVPVKETLPERYRGILALNSDLCISCMRCAVACPIDCIFIDRAKEEGAKVFILKQFEIDIAKCMFCGLCVEACPVCPEKALTHSKEFEGATSCLDDLKFILSTIPRSPMGIGTPGI